MVDKSTVDLSILKSINQSSPQMPLLDVLAWSYTLLMSCHFMENTLQDAQSSRLPWKSGRICIASYRMTVHVILFYLPFPTPGLDSHEGNPCMYDHVHGLLIQRLFPFLLAVLMIPCMILMLLLMVCIICLCIVWIRRRRKMHYSRLFVTCKYAWF